MEFLRLAAVAPLALAFACAEGGSTPDASIGTGADAHNDLPDASNGGADAPIATIDAPGPTIDGSPLNDATPSYDATPMYDASPMYDAAPMSDAPPVIVGDILLMGHEVIDADWDTFRVALTAAGVTWTELNLDTLPFPTALELAAYDILIWFDESVIAQGDAECQLIVDWLNGGGKNLFTASVDFVWDFENGLAGLGENNLYVQMGVSYTGDYAGTAVATIDGVALGPIGGDFVAPSGLMLAGTSDSDGDYFAAGSATLGGVYGAGGSGSGSGGLSHRDTGTFKIVTLGVNFHNGLTNAAQRNTLMANVLGFFSN